MSVLVYGAEWCADCHRTKDFLDTYGITYEYKDIDSDADIQSEILSLTGGNKSIPVVKVDDAYWQEPSNEKLKEIFKVTETEASESNIYDVLMVGAGPAALSAAIYTTREDLNTILYEKGAIGGLAAITDWIDNYPGFVDGVAGLELAESLRKQAERFGAKIELGEVLSISDNSGFKIINTTDGIIKAKSVLIATGSEYKKLGIPGELEYYGRGVHYCATCDGAFYRDKRLVVVGGGNSAVQEAIFLTKFASSIDLLVRGDAMRASEVLQHELEKHKDKIKIHFNTTTDEIMATDNKVTSVKGTDVKTGLEVHFETDGVFIFIGLVPTTMFLKDTLIQLDDFGFIKTNEDLQTSMPGVFAAGDVRSGATMQIASASGEGATAALKIREYLKAHH